MEEEIDCFESAKEVFDDGPYWQMGYYGMVGFLFASLFVNQVPFIDEYFGGPSVLSYIYLAYGMSSNIVRIILIYYGNISEATFGSQLSWLVIYGGILTGLVFFMFPLSMFIIGKTDMGFWICLLLSVMMGTFNSFLRNVGFGLMSMAPEKSAIFFLVGQSMTGVITWPLLILLRYLFKSFDSRDIIVATITLTLAGLITLGIVPLYFYKTRTASKFVDILKMKPPKSLPGTLLTVFRKIFGPAFCGWICLAMTFCLFPSQVTRWSPYHGEDSAYTRAEFHSFLIYVFSVSETVGRAVTKSIPSLKRVGNSVFTIITVSRGLVFIALFLMASNNIPHFFSLDWVRLILLVGLGATAGLNYTLANILAPKRVSVEDKMQVGTILSFIGTNGSFVGAMIGLGLCRV